MYSRSSLFVLAIGFSILIVLIGFLGFGAIRRADAIYRDMHAAQDAYVQTETFRRGIATDVYLADILLRDYLLDPSPQSAPHHRQELLAIRQSLQQRLDELSKLVPENDSPELSRLQTEVEAYWDSLDPIFDWTAKEKSERSWLFLARKVLPRREAVVSLAREMARMNAENLDRERQRLQTSQDVLHRFLLQMMTVALILGSFVALLTSYRVLVLERRHHAQRKQIEETQNNLRRLSQRLVQAQELERTALSRELHDEVGQMMTALGMELRNLEMMRDLNRAAFEKRMEEVKRLNADAMRAIRDLAMGLRPSMLDDLGLEAALQWQGREFSRHTGVPAVVQVNSTVDELSDSQRTCIYRVVQEALTNCARHANARNVVVSIRNQNSGIVVVVQDDGIGFNPSLRGGLGLLGIQERVQALDGQLHISSAPGRGTTVKVELPVAVAA
ncbi:MAG TPA: ATP-binding protein [Terriglobia bacterium]|nr:ATP-binding protein [Terriglobia bacterium]